MKHILLSIVSFFHHHPAEKPALDKLLLDRTIADLPLVDEDKVICVYPLPNPSR